MLQIHTFDARSGGNVLYKALSHPLVAEAIGRLYNRMRGPVALYDPDTVADALIALYPTAIEGIFVHDVSLVGHNRAGLAARPLTELPNSACRTVLIAAF